MEGIRPCPWVGCRYHLYLDVRENGTIILNFPDTAPWETPETCTLDVAEQGGLTLEAVGALMSLDRERVRQIEADVLGMVRTHFRMRAARRRRAG
jgi:hypothetical protein